jgi:hypothetical protein
VHEYSGAYSPKHEDVELAEGEVEKGDVAVERFEEESLHD